MPFLDNYSNEEKLESPHTILRSICHMQAILDNPKNSDVVESVLRIIHSEEEEEKKSGGDSDDDSEEEDDLVSPLVASNFGSHLNLGRNFSIRD